MTNKKLILQIDFRSGLPIYTQIVNQIQVQVVGGVLKPETNCQRYVRWPKSCE